MNEIPAVVSDYISAYNDLDVAGMIRCLSDDVHFVNKSGDDISAETQGVAAFRELALQGVAIFTQRKQTITNAIACGGHVTLEIDYSATVAGDLPNGWKAGQTIAIRGVSVFSLKGGKIAELVDIS
ncbi:SnoaL-like domain-containing protein [Pseudoxanthobacter soli DSM 19599]|uniref:SnoaL-like domain-containing protein n=1 Tax=Pseudoxanthobacter soli DSM 19599 TaxID=1123029 RepID=A0A1M7Z8N9_9HYPH|nr:nuclear transport factor 2 family protein [Pseudoxanthobacter soli]SHO61199.1 SnoaL-like domain-containing protein [Pseudoxanthobacter soli DSM 19599]